MPATQRRRHIGLIADFFRYPQRYGFFQAVRLLERWLVRRGAGVPGQVVEDRLRFPNSDSLAFPPSEIAGVMRYDIDGRIAQSTVGTGGPSGPEGDAAASSSPSDGGALQRMERIAVTPAFFGLLGAQGALPHYYTEALAEYEHRTRDRGTRAFLDIFSTRAGALLYGAWKKYRLPLRHETDADHHYLPLLLALGGLGHPALHNRLRDGDDGVFDESLARYAAALQQRPVSSAYLARVLEDYFQAPIRVEPFVGKWYTLPPAHRTRLGTDGAILGGGAHPGERVWQRNLCLRVCIGPLSHRAFMEFLPSGPRARALRRLLALLMGTGYEYEVRLVLRADAVRGSVLGDGASALGYGAFLCTAPDGLDRDDAVYDLHSVK